MVACLFVGGDMIPQVQCMNCPSGGLFTNDRELLECSAYGLKEDVTGGGVLIAYRDEAGDSDTGLRFLEPDDDGMSICPGCGGR